MDCNCDACRRIVDHESPGPWSTLAVVLAWLTVLGVFLWGR
ncbi:MAG: hypothetical protein PHQ43_07545 [Dehalococcoidales bacterium]|nr:hypothetical protein [Dehalococcoidales bacterium]